jgi:AAA15 family ATPase/GTPase
MLIEFSVENFRSIKKIVTLSLLASSDKSLDDNLIKTDVLKKDNLLRSAVIYGANASGKTNIVLAFSFLRNLVINSHKNQKDDKLDLSPFKLDKEYISKPSKFEIIFIKDNVKYIYGVSATNEKIIDEYLYYYPPKGRKSIIFERKDTNHFRFTKDKEEQKFLSERTINNVLYLSSSTQLNYKITSEVFDWFKDKLQTIDTLGNPKWIQSTIDLFNEDDKSKKFVLKSLLEADLGIEDVIASIEKISSDDIPIELKKKKRGRVWGDEDGIKKINIETIHKVIDEKDEVSYIPMDYFNESGGTQRIFEMIGTWINALKNGHIIIVDELDVKLHNLLNLFLIKLFHDTTQNISNAQLIFTTHNTNLLDLDIFRRDQIWFTEKNPNSGSTDLYSLMEYSPRKDMDIQKGYLAGRFGAIPFISEERIF